MAEFIFFMHTDTTGPVRESAWGPYLEALGAAAVLRGGSAIGAGACQRREGPVPAITDHLAGFVRVEARDLAHARALLAGNPVYDAGGTVEIRELPRTD